MIELDPPDVFGSAIFCDDIRFEVDGKLTFVGVYNGTMVVRGQFPATLPKFAINVTFQQRKEVYVPKLKLRVYLPGDPEGNDPIEVDLESQQGGLIAGNEQPEHPRIAAIANLILAPLTLNCPGAIKVRILREDTLYRLGTLTVIEATSPNAPPPPV